MIIRLRRRDGGQGTDVNAALPAAIAAGPSWREDGT